MIIFLAEIFIDLLFTAPEWLTKGLRIVGLGSVVGWVKGEQSHHT